jgi:protein TonB
MNSVMEGGNHLERELTPERIAPSVVGSLVLHLALAGLVFYYAWFLGLLHHDLWGSQGAGGAMSVNLVSSALPLPNNQPLNQNVLATETPSQAPAAPSAKQTQQVDETAIPIAGRNAQPNKSSAPKTQQHQPVARPQNLAQYGEQAGSSMPRSMRQQPGSGGPAAVGDSDFAGRFGWYVDQINRKMQYVWNKGQVDPHTPKGARVFLVFTIYHDGSHNNPQLDHSSGSPTLDRSCLQAVQRVDTFGGLPSSYNQSKLEVSYYCEY